MATVQKNEKLEQLIKDVKRDIMFQVIMNMRHYELTMQDAQYLAQDVLKMFPVRDEKELLAKLYELGKLYKETRAVFIKYAVPFYEEEKARVLPTVAEFLKHGELDLAVTYMKGVTHHG